EIGPESADVGDRVHLEEICRVPLLGREDGPHDILVHKDAGRELERLLQDADDRQVDGVSRAIERPNPIPRDYPKAALVRHELVRPCGAAVHDGEAVVVREGGPARLPGRRVPPDEVVYAITSYPPDCCRTNVSRLEAWRPWTIEMRVTMKRMRANIATVIPVRKRFSVG